MRFRLPDAAKKGVPVQRRKVLRHRSEHDDLYREGIDRPAVTTAWEDMVLLAHIHRLLPALSNATYGPPHDARASR